MTNAVDTTKTSELTARQLESLFKQATSSMSSGAGSMRGNKLSYFTPGSSGVTGEDGRTSFGATVPTFSGWHGGEVTVHMYVRDLGQSREVRLYVPYNLGGGGAAKKALRKLEKAMGL